MSEQRDTSGPQFRADRPEEQEAVRTTIVGGRPPGSGQRVGPIPRGIEVLVKKAAVDPAFRALLLDRRAEAADTIGLELDPAEVMMLGAVPRGQLETIIARTNVPQQHRRAFLGTAAAAMLATLGIGAAGCGDAEKGRTQGIQPDQPPGTKGIRPERVPVTGSAPDRPPLEKDSSVPGPGARPDESMNPPERPQQPPAPTGIRPDPPPPTRGIQPDRP